MWHGLALRTRNTHKSAVFQWDRYAANYSIAAWSVTTALLEQWIVDRTVGSSDRIQATTMESYLQALRSHHIDKRLSTAVFDTAIIKRLLCGAKSLYPSLRRERLPQTWRDNLWEKRESDKWYLYRHHTSRRLHLCHSRPPYSPVETLKDRPRILGR
jgi:hypothetical protein